MMKGHPKKTLDFFRPGGGERSSNFNFLRYEGERVYRNSDIWNFVHINFRRFQKLVVFRKILVRFLQNQSLKLRYISFNMGEGGVKKPGKIPTSFIDGPYLEG